MSRNNIVANFAKNINTAANAVTTPITNMAANVANAITRNGNVAFSNVLNTPNSTSSIDSKIYVWVLVIAVVIGVVWLIKRFVLDENPGMLDSWLSMFRKTQQSGATEVIAPPIMPPPSREEAPVHPDLESWCFVGEDLTGRYCVKVPSTGSCDAGRTYKTRQDCELVPAQHLPASIVTKQGTAALPLLSGN